MRHRLERPVIARVSDLHEVSAFGPHRALLDPRRQRRDLRRRQRFAFRRHPLVLVVRGHHLEQRTLLHLARDDVRRVVVTALQRGRLDVEPQTGLLLLRPVAFVAVLLKNRPHFAREIDRRGQGEIRQKQRDEPPTRGSKSGGAPPHYKAFGERVQPHRTLRLLRLGRGRGSFIHLRAHVDVFGADQQRGLFRKARGEQPARVASQSRWRRSCRLSRSGNCSASSWSGKPSSFRLSDRCVAHVEFLLLHVRLHLRVGSRKIARLVSPLSLYAAWSSWK